ncbi:metallophosphoesterase family protein [Alcanivorax sp. JB21]|uniref:purple acid phosphatase family protein n=1 Tax=Alcanivorax limicola TaxID=2874102 RepID=UPI001CBB0136|nr:metallophosphoesterase family protein [Alcanivorax limicola]MBZ2188507.1 metallophosphoesterase family protein [Alcanivorax limicola]
MADSKVSSTRRTLLQGLAGATLAAGTSACGGGGSAGNGTTPQPVTPGTPGTPSSDSHAPRGVHASVLEDPHTTRTLTWFTDGLNAPQSMVVFDQPVARLSDAEDARRPFPRGTTGTVERTFGVNAQTHRVTLRGLDPERPIRYRVGSDQGGWSRTFWLDPVPQDTWRFMHFGDHGVSGRAHRVTEEALKHPTDLLLLAGDLSYADGNQPVWDQWFSEVEPLLASTITMAAPGNHEAKDGGGRQSGQAFKSRLTHPDPRLSVVGNNEGSTFYSFRMNRVHFLVSSAGALIEDFSLAEELVNMEIDLAAAALARLRGEIDFIAVMQHYPIWTDQLGRSPANFTLVALEEDILLRYGVDLLLVGHDHVYQRSQKMAYGGNTPVGYMQVMVGTGGQSVRLFDEAPQRWSAFQFIGLGLATYEVSPGKITGAFHGAAPVGDEGDALQTVVEPFSVRDTFSIERRSLAACEQCALPPRDPEVLLRNFPMIVHHTRMRNRLAFEHCG